MSFILVAAMEYNELYGRMCRYFYGFKMRIDQTENRDKLEIIKFCYCNFQIYHVFIMCQFSAIQVVVKQHMLWHAVGDECISKC